jgi:hypothetical protein
MFPHTGTWTLNEFVLVGGDATSDNLPPRFTASSTTCGVRSTRTEMSSTSWSRAGAARPQPSGSFRKLLRGLRYIPRVIVTDKLKSYAAAKREILPSVEHRQSRYLNNRVEVSHQPTRRRERQMKRFNSALQSDPQPFPTPS